MLATSVATTPDKDNGRRIQQFVRRIQDIITCKVGCPSSSYNAALRPPTSDHVYRKSRARAGQLLKAEAWLRDEVVHQRSRGSTCVAADERETDRSEVC